MPLLFVAFIHLVSVAQVSHWATLPFYVNRGQVGFYNDTATKSLYIYGSFNKVDSSTANIIKWDGVSYTLLKHPRNTIIGQILRYNNYLYVDGDGGLSRYDGTNWEIMDSFCTGIGGMYVWHNKLLCAGNFRTICGHAIPRAAQFDGTNWTDFYNVDTLLNATEIWSIGSVVDYKGETYIAGNLNPQGKPLISEIARFDGQHWKDVGGGIQGNGLAAVGQMLVWKEQLYVSGMFNVQDGSPGNCIVRWDGQKWHRLGEGMPEVNAAILRMAIFRDKLYAVGNFNYVDKIKANYIASWDGFKWCSLGDTSDYDSIDDIVDFKDSLYIGGPFWSINGDSSYHHFAKWTGGDYVKECSVPTSVTEHISLQFNAEIAPSPSLNGKFNVDFNNQQRIIAAQIIVCNTTGQIVYQMQNSHVGNNFSKEINLGAVVPGVYFVAIIADGDRVLKRLVVE
ncbi:MAG: T9SS type A sorting domain-containing protein [Chitinophagaceae bacterium]